LNWLLHVEELEYHSFREIRGQPLLHLGKDLSNVAVPEEVVPVDVKKRTEEEVSEDKILDLARELLHDLLIFLRSYRIVQISGPSVAEVELNLILDLLGERPISVELLEGGEEQAELSTVFVVFIRILNSLDHPH